MLFRSVAAEPQLLNGVLLFLVRLVIILVFFWISSSIFSWSECFRFQVIGSLHKGCCQVYFHNLGTLTSEMLCSLLCFGRALTVFRGVMAALVVSAAVSTLIIRVFIAGRFSAGLFATIISFATTLSIASLAIQIVGTVVRFVSEFVIVCVDAKAHSETPEPAVGVVAQ
jgi:hypothetical protein